jgi:hypothetical protein
LQGAAIGIADTPRRRRYGLRHTRAALLSFAHIKPSSSKLPLISRLFYQT